VLRRAGCSEFSIVLQCRAGPRAANTADVLCFAPAILTPFAHSRNRRFGSCRDVTWRVWPRSSGTEPHHAARGFRSLMSYRDSNEIRPFGAMFVELTSSGRT
jgi:hypothetical protein